MSRRSNHGGDCHCGRCRPEKHAIRRKRELIAVRVDERQDPNPVETMHSDAKEERARDVDIGPPPPDEPWEDHSDCEQCTGYSDYELPTFECATCNASFMSQESADQCCCAGEATPGAEGFPQS